MRVVFDPEFDLGAWPGPLHGRQACSGEIWVGEIGLLGFLEGGLGLTGVYPSAGERAAALVRNIQETPGFWTESAKSDPLGTARKLLSWRDRLFLAGWRGEPLNGIARVNQLAAATAGAQPGIPDRLLAVSASLAKRSLNLEHLVSYFTIESMQPAWREVFTRLAGHGIRIEVKVVESLGASDSDLGGARASKFTARGDGSLQLLSADGPLEAAEEVAAWLASLPTLSDAVVVGSEPILDSALRRHGLPATGATSGPEDNVLLQILPLVLALGWTPADPERVLELLTLPDGPVPPSVARRLARALLEWPAVGSDLWKENLVRSLEAIPDEGRRGGLAERLSRLFEPTVSGADGSYRLADVRDRVGVLQRWLRGRLERVSASERLPWEQLRTQLTLFINQVDLSGLDAFNGSHLRRLVEQATASVGSVEVHEAQAGLPRVGAATGIAGPAGRIVWWSFTRDSVRVERPLPFSAAERAALAQAGVALADPAQQALLRASRWRRPLLCASETLVLVSPRRAPSGEQSFPHPLWDEIAASAGGSVRLLERTTIKAQAPIPRAARELKPIVTPTRAWRIAPGRVSSRAVESPRGAESLIGCSLQWVLRYGAGIHGGISAALPSIENLIGKMTHEILARVLQEDCTPDRSEERARAIFDAIGPRLAAPLFLPGAEADRTAVRLAASRSARVLTQLLADRQATVASVESAYRFPALGTTLEGRPDLVLNRPLSVIDLKWRGRGYRRDELAAGTSLQLSAYSFLVREGNGPFPPVAFFILSRQELLSMDGSAFPSAFLVDGPPPSQVWSAVESAYEGRRREMVAGQVEAPGNPDAEGLIPAESFLVEGRLVLAPPCKFCELHGLCGAAYLRERS